MTGHFGKFRGEVLNVLDPLGLGRIQVGVPGLLEGSLAWAMPCLPGAGPNVGIFVIPPVGAKVWVEFERGDLDYPIWSGGFWGTGETPAPMGPTQAMTRVWAGDNFRIEILDMPGAGTLAITLTTPGGEAKLAADASALELSWGSSSVKLSVDGVSINGSNLKVLP
jgi:Type VI secretion system/phage-baseplate injector OB domain